MEESQDFEQKQEENIDHSQLVEKSQMELNEEKEEQKNKIVEESPKGRFKRLNDTLGRGAFKTVYRAIDIDTGNEVAWNVIQVRDLKSKDKRRVIQEIEIIKSLNHENLIHFISAWHNTKTQEVVIITEMITGGSLKTHLRRVKSPKLKVIKSYCKMILKGLEYLHNQSSPIIHRDLKCDNIFINSNDGKIFIGDLGLSTSMQTNYNKTVLGTPEFMAPELYEEHYDTSVDIWAFGMTVIEMTTNCTPYSECENFAQVYRKIMDRTPPEALNKIKDEQLKKFIQKCLTEPQNRPNATTLLQDEWLNDETHESNNEVVALYDIIPNLTTKKSNNNVNQFDSQTQNDKQKKQTPHLSGNDVKQQDNQNIEKKLVSQRITINTTDLQNTNEPASNDLQQDQNHVQQITQEIPELVSQESKSVEKKETQVLNFQNQVLVNVYSNQISQQEALKIDTSQQQQKQQESQKSPSKVLNQSSQKFEVQSFKSVQSRRGLTIVSSKTITTPNLKIKNIYSQNQNLPLNTQHFSEFNQFGWGGQEIEQKSALIPVKESKYSQGDSSEKKYSHREISASIDNEIQESHDLIQSSHINAKKLNSNVFNKQVPNQKQPFHQYHQNPDNILVSEPATAVFNQPNIYKMELIIRNKNREKQIQFYYDEQRDKPQQIAEELVNELKVKNQKQLFNQLVVQIQKLKERIQKHQHSQQEITPQDHNNSNLPNPESPLQNTPIISQGIKQTKLQHDSQENLQNDKKTISRRSQSSEKMKYSMQELQRRKSSSQTRFQKSVQRNSEQSEDYQEQSEDYKEQRNNKITQNILNQNQNPSISQEILDKVPPLSKALQINGDNSQHDIVVLQDSLTQIYQQQFSNLNKFGPVVEKLVKQ